MPPNPKSVELPNQVRLHYVEQGGPEGVPLALLHGYADSWHVFEPLLQHLPDSIHAFAVTQRGHGDSSHPASGYSSRDFAEDLRAFLDAVQVEAAVIAGGSSGGFAARRFALDHPEQTLGLVLMGSPLTLRDKPAVLKVWDKTISKLADPIDPEFVREFQGSSLVLPGLEADLDQLVQESRKVPARVWRAAFEGFLRDDSLGELDRIAVPTLIAWGDQDPILPRTDQVALAEGIAGSQFVVYPGAGHAFYWEEPERFARDLVAFVEDVGAQVNAS